ncbi:putative pentatricopeptide repeat-containing protein [Hibiscus syriacus]|uniref:Pentatricopeptide repeat-containing protein n=1 Tax=Hibiscus syriacus TaxID=106335 RepID=A0A6A3CSN4_HIBSY|nr:putative pentatricopeptide repeat-containing protein [Hibiscus syriacus]
MGSRGRKEVNIHITGFKKFRGVAENPTETIVNNLMSFVQSKRLLPPGVTLGSCTVLETAGDGALPELYNVLESGTSGNGNKKKNVIWLHLGVDSGARKFALEQQAVNEATFVCPDELGWQPMTTCSIEAILKFLQKKGYDATISNDAGLFVCNYVYYHSLRFAEQKGHKSLFVHVPLFSRINEESQMQFIATVLAAIASTC